MAQTILVTGSSSGFGRLTVDTLARQGYIVVAGMWAVAVRNAPAAEALRALADRERLAVQIVELDITDDASVEQAITSLVRITGRLDVVVNNAGIAFSPYSETNLRRSEAITLLKAEEGTGQMQKSFIGALQLLPAN